MVDMVMHSKMIHVFCDVSDVSISVTVSPIRSMYGGYHGLVVVTPPRPHFIVYAITLKKPYRIASIFDM